MLLILPILLIILILVILFFVNHNSIIVMEIVNYVKNNWARLVPPIIKLWWNKVKVYFVWDSFKNYKCIL